MVLFYTNAGSLINKLDELKISLPVYNPDVLCISESHYSQEIENSEVDIVGYRCFRADRGFKTKGKDELATDEGDGECSGTFRGGGSVIYVKDYINPKLCSSFKAPDSLAVKLQCDLVIMYIL